VWRFDQSYGLWDMSRGQSYKSSLIVWEETHFYTKSSTLCLRPRPPIKLSEFSNSKNEPQH